MYNKKNTHRFNEQINKKLFVFLKKTDDKRKFKIKKIKENICHLFFKQSENKKEKQYLTLSGKNTVNCGFIMFSLYLITEI